MTIDVQIHHQMKAMFVIYTAGCNSRCVTCDYWLDEDQTGMPNDALLGVITEAWARGLQVVYFTGGEALLRAADLFELVDALAVRCPSLSVHLLTNGVLLKKHAERIARSFSRVIVSMDAADPGLYRRIRGLRAFALVTDGIAQLREVDPDLDIRLRTMVLPENVDSLPGIVRLAIALKVNRISFLAEDVSSTIALGRDVLIAGSSGRSEMDRAVVATNLESQIETIRAMKVTEADRQVLVTGLSDLERVLDIYSGRFQRTRCNAGLRSCVVDADGSVGPCFFIEASGSLIDASLGSVLTSVGHARVVESILDGSRRECQDCVCPRFDEE
ncbi:MAG: radical SAM protein [Candidatus Phosphoribacter sp.]